MESDFPPDFWQNSTGIWFLCNLKSIMKYRFSSTREFELLKQELARINGYSFSVQAIWEHTVKNMYLHVVSKLSLASDKRVKVVDSCFLKSVLIYNMTYFASCLIWYNLYYTTKFTYIEFWHRSVRWLRGSFSLFWYNLCYMQKFLLDGIWWLLSLSFDRPIELMYNDTTLAIG